MLAFVLLAAVSTIVSSPSSSGHSRETWLRHKNHHSIEHNLKQYSDTVPTVVTNSGGFYGDIFERKEVLDPIPAKCMPESRTVKLWDPNDVSIIYHPSCTRVERCGGCCPLEEYHSCQPSQIEMLKFKVSLSKYTGGSKYTSLGTKILKVERHLKCECKCKRKPSDCNALQEYIKHECKCRCTNHDEKRKCTEGDNNLKSWDSNACTCQCKIIKDCTTGYAFNKHTCNCEAEHRQRIRGGYGSNYPGKEP